MTATRMGREVYRDPILYLGKEYSLIEVIEQLMVMELRGFFGLETGEFVSNNANWIASLDPEATITWERDEDGEIAPFARF